MFQKAVKHEAKLRLAIAGPSGSGKTYTSLKVATILAQEGDGGVAVVDTEHGSASKYADLFEFDVVEFGPPFHPDRFVEAIHAAEDAGYEVVVLDSLSHAWNGTGGLLEIVDVAARKYKGNSYMAWSDGTPIQNRLIEAITGSRIHVIVTMRSKQDYILVERNGKQVPQKVGLAPIQREGFEYEFDLFLEMDVDNNGIVSKTRCPVLTGAVLPQPGGDLAKPLMNWLSGAKPPTQEELAAQAWEAETVEAFVQAAYKLDGPANVVESQQRLADWANFVLGDLTFEEGHGVKLLPILEDYCDQVANGSRVKEAAESAKQAAQAALAPPEAQPEPEPEETPTA